MPRRRVDRFRASQCGRDVRGRRNGRVNGLVAGFAWTNPHCHVYIDVASGPFAGRTYTVELGSPSALTGDGWTKTSLRPGDHVVMMVNPSRAGAAQGLCRRCAVTLNGSAWRSPGAVG